ncbi:MAG: prepilin peptidase [Deltaproteobacteria bacterium]|nr:prepilin peptidase [Deltaproteobacteria bacterium]
MMILLISFVFGAAVGSFLNVCIARIPSGESIVRPPSRCPKCGAGIRVYDNVPLFGYLFLRGRCRDCKEPISLRYPLIEALTGFLFALLVYRFELSPPIIAYAAFVSALIVVSFIDLDHQIIPDGISLPGIVVGLLFALSGYGPGFVDSLLGVLLGGGTLWAVAAGYEWLRGQEGMGGGDIKLLAMIGAFLGWRAVLVTLIVGSLTGAILGSLRILIQRTQAGVPIPFGPFLAIGALIALFAGEQLIDWYLGLAFAL